MEMPVCGGDRSGRGVFMGRSDPPDAARGFSSSGSDAAAVGRSLWRNGRARWTSNPEVPGSSPGRDDLQAGVSFLLMPVAL